MPMSGDLGGWTLPSQPCFQVYGTKRKNTDADRDLTVHHQNSMEYSIAKRKCILPLSEESRHHLRHNGFQWQETPTNSITDMSGTLQQVISTQIFTESGEDHIEMMESEQTSRPQQLETCNQQNLKSQEFGRQQRELLIKRTEKLEEQLKFIREQDVESNDYWAAPSDSQLTMQDELEQARIQMESDFSLDPYQYSYAGPDTLPMMGYDIRSKVRCYCKPTWEGVMNQNCFI